MTADRPKQNSIDHNEISSGLQKFAMYEM